MKHWPWIVAIASFAAMGTGLFVMQPHHEEDPGFKVNSFSADLAFFFNCKDKANPPSDEVIEGFMADKGFRVLNKVRLAKEENADYHWMKMDIIGIDSARRKINFTAFPGQPNTYNVGLWSEPPTRHSTDLENAVLEFTEKTLGCSNYQVQRFQNSAEAKDVYDYSFKETEGWFEQAAEMRK